MLSMLMASISLDTGPAPTFIVMGDKMRKLLSLIFAFAALVFANSPSTAQTLRSDALANAPFTQGFLAKPDIAALKDELAFQRAVQAYLWAISALNMYGMKERSEKAFGQGHNVSYRFSRVGSSASTLKYTERH